MFVITSTIFPPIYSTNSIISISTNLVILLLLLLLLVIIYFYLYSCFYYYSIIQCVSEAERSYRKPFRNPSHMRRRDIESIDWTQQTLTIQGSTYKFTVQSRLISNKRYVYAHLRINGKVENICLGKHGERWQDGTLLTSDRKPNIHNQ
jgi:hypothetical protein